MAANDGFDGFGSIDKRQRELEARLAQGVGRCRDCGKPATGYCITCEVLLCEEHDFAHVVADAGSCTNTGPRTWEEKQAQS